jgi:Flp pilus assembly protein TadD
MAAAADVRICPACGTRNKKKWEFCVKCSEPLQDVPVGEPAPAAAAASEPDVDDGAASTVPGALVFIGLMALGVALALHWRPEQGAPPASVFVPPVGPDTEHPPRGVPPVADAGAESYRQGHALLMRREFAAAIPLLEEALAKVPDRALYANALGRARLGAGDASGAAEAYGQASQLDPTSLHYARDHAYALVTLSRFDEARSAYAGILERQPANTDALRDLATLELKTNRPREAAELLRRASAARPRDVEIRQELGQALQDAGELDRAAEVYSGILADMPQAPITRGQLSEVYLKQGDAGRAEAVLRDGLQGSPSSAMLHRALGSLLVRQGRTDEAAAAYREYMRLSPDAPDAAQIRAALERIETRRPAQNPS